MSVHIYIVIFLTLIAAFLASIAQVMFKKSLPKNVSFRGIFALAKNKGIVLGLLIYLVSLVIYLFALSSAPLSFVYPTFASSFIFVALLSFFLIKESFTFKRIAGILLIFIGILIVGLTM